MNPIPTNPEASEAAHCRESFGRREYEVRSCGNAFFLVVFVNLAWAAFALWLKFAGEGKNYFNAMPDDRFYSLLGASLASAAIALLLACALRTLQPWIWLPGFLLSTFLLPNFPFGTLMAFVCILVLAAPGSRNLFTPQYLEIVRATPGYRYKPATNKLGVTFLIALVVGTLVLMFYVDRIN